MFSRGVGFFFKNCKTFFNKIQMVQTIFCLIQFTKQNIQTVFDEHRCIISMKNIKNSKKRFTKTKKIIGREKLQKVFWVFSKNCKTCLHIDQTVQMVHTISSFNTVHQTEHWDCLQRSSVFNEHRLSSFSMKNSQKFKKAFYKNEKYHQSWKISSFCIDHKVGLVQTIFFLIKFTK